MKLNRTMIRAGAVALAVLPLALALARDLGPQRTAVTLPGGAGALAAPTGDTGRFYPSHMIFSCAAGETQTVRFVHGTVTNTYGTKVVAAGDAVMVLTNVPPLFSGDKILVASSATGVTNTATVIGTLYD